MKMRRRAEHRRRTDEWNPGRNWAEGTGNNWTTGALGLVSEQSHAQASVCPSSHDSWSKHYSKGNAQTITRDAFPVGVIEPSIHESYDYFLRCISGWTGTHCVDQGNLQTQNAFQMLGLEE